MKRDEFNQKLTGRLKANGLDYETMMKKIGDDLAKAMNYHMEEKYSNLQKTLMTVTRCVSGHMFGYIDSDVISEINGKKICNNCERTYLEKYATERVAEHSTFEEFVESQVVLEKLTEED
ncbi:gp670 [Bacillus phage G]|uniref:Gp670 n=1 Tax=Bacillus phage G TaxID=2884420 RepID=G3MB50_9CAUD|nr:gp670 [Bacillus phage G]AEO93913.1 gp670 [Bacillus phage G]